MNRKTIRADYEGCLDAMARLSAYATSKPFVDALEVNERQDILAVNDLINFCIHARRLIEGVELKDYVFQKTIKISESVELSIWKIINYFIHHDDLEIIRSQSRVRMINASSESKTKQEFWQKIGPELNKKSYSEPIKEMVVLDLLNVHVV